MAILQVSIPLKTEVIEAHHDLVTNSYFDPETSRVIIEIDVRRKKWKEILGLSRKDQIHWADVRTVDIQELSSAMCPIIYRVTYGDGWYSDKSGKRQYFPIGPHLRGIDLDRQCTTVVLRAAIFLAVMAGVGLRATTWLMQTLFLVVVSKSSLDRWIKECAAQLPDAAGMAKILNGDKPITEGHFDEIFAKGQRPKRCTLVLRDEHGRIFTAREVQERNEETVTSFLRDVKSWGIGIKQFYVDGCEAYRKAIGNVFPEAVIQYDYFHIIQGIFRKLRCAFVSHRRQLKARGKDAETPWYQAKLEAMAQKLWESRGLIFKNPDRISAEEQQQLLALMEEDHFVDTLRHFMLRVWGIFRDSEGELGARQRLGHLKQLQVVQDDPRSHFAKSVAFLEERFDDMIAFLCHPGVKRNSLAETGIRCLRRLERGHDGFRGPEGFDCYLRIYQAIKYCGWTVHGPFRGLGLQDDRIICPPTPVVTTG